MASPTAHGQQQELIDLCREGERAREKVREKEKERAGLGLGLTHAD